MRHVAVRGAHRDRQVGVSGIVDGQIQSGGHYSLLFALHEAVSGVSGCHDDDDPGTNQPVHFHAEGTLSASEPFRIEVVPDREVDAMHEQPPAIAIDTLDVLQGRHDAACATCPVAFAVVVQDLETEELAARRHPRKALEVQRTLPLFAVFVAVPCRGDDLRGGVVHLPGDDARHVSAMAKPVRQSTGFGRREVLMLEREVDLQVLVLLKVWMRAVDARINHRPRDLRAQGGKRVVSRVPLDGADRFVDQRLEIEVRPDAVDRSIDAGRTWRAVAADELLDGTYAQRGKDVLHVLSLVSVHALFRSLGFRLLDDLADHRDDVRASAIGSLAVVQVQIDRNVKQPVGLFLELLQQWNRDDRSVQNLRQESNPFECP